jgi:hypothetical protein
MAQLTSNATVCTLFLFCAHFFASFGIWRFFDYLDSANDGDFE